MFLKMDLENLSHVAYATVLGRKKQVYVWLSHQQEEHCIYPGVESSQTGQTNAGQLPDSLAMLLQIRYNIFHQF